MLSEATIQLVRHSSQLDIVRRVVVGVCVGVVAPLVFVFGHAALAVLVHRVARIERLVLQQGVCSGALRGRREDGHPAGRRMIWGVWHSSWRLWCRSGALRSVGWGGSGRGGGRRCVTRGRWRGARSTRSARSRSTLSTLTQCYQYNLLEYILSKKFQVINWLCN